jgi:hypothetical protein
MRGPERLWAGLTAAANKTRISGMSATNGRSSSSLRTPSPSQSGILHGGVGVCAAVLPPQIAKAMIRHVRSSLHAGIPVSSFRDGRNCIASRRRAASSVLAASRCARTRPALLRPARARDGSARGRGRGRKMPHSATGRPTTPCCPARCCSGGPAGRDRRGDPIAVSAGERVLTIVPQASATFRSVWVVVASGVYAESARDSSNP